MTDLSALSLKSAAAVGRSLASGAADPVALTELLLEKITAAEDDKVFLRVTAERALREARASAKRLAEGRPLSALDGVPLAWKDLVDMAGETTTAASDIYRAAPPATADAPIVTNAAAAGMVSLGKVNLTEFAYSGLGLNPHYGTPPNPRSPQVPRAPGGSSSGSAVAVASGLAPCAIGTDTGGSVRIPASFNGLVGYKSSEGRIASDGVFPLSRTLDSVGPIARSVEDCILLDAVLRGEVTSSVRRQPLEGAAFFVAENIVLEGLALAVAANFEASLKALEAAGAKIARGSLPALSEAAALTADHGSITAADAYAEHRQLVEGPEVGRIDRRVVARIMIGKAMGSADLLALQRARPGLVAGITAALDGAFLLMPTTAITAPEIAPLEADDDLFHKTNLLVLRNTALGNYLNTPGVALPNGVDGEGLPTSLLISAPAGQDDRLLGIAQAVERCLSAV